MTDNAKPATAPAPAQAAETQTSTEGTNVTLASAPSSSSLPMFIASSDVGQEQMDQNLDLDDLFRDCYFGDFPMNGAPPKEAESEAAQPPPAPRPLMSNTAFYTPEEEKPVVATPATTAPKTVTSTAVTTPPTTTAVKRKADEALVDAVPSAALSSSVLLGSDLLGSDKKDPSKALTDQQKVERRERNRKHAKRSRLRKKFLLESLQEQISGLQSEIDSLKDIIRAECPDKAESLFDGISGPKGKFTPLPMPSGFGPVKTLMEPDFRLMSALSGSQQNFAISDPSLPDNPIVYVSQGFLDLTGYTLDQVLGRNCRFLQGPGTDQSAVDIIRKGVREGVDTSVCLLNYKADGTPFWNQFFVAALRDAENNVVNFVGVQCEVSKAVVEKQLKEKAEADSKVNADVAK